MAKLVRVYSSLFLVGFIALTSINVQSENNCTNESKTSESLLDEAQSIDSNFDHIPTFQFDFININSNESKQSKAYISIPLDLHYISYLKAFIYIHGKRGPPLS